MTNTEGIILGVGALLLIAILSRKKDYQNFLPDDLKPPYKLFKGEQKPVPVPRPFDLDMAWDYERFDGR